DIPDRASGRLQRSHACRHAQRCRNGAGTRRHTAPQRRSCRRAGLLDRDGQTDARDSVITSKEPAMKRAFVKLTLPIVLVFALPIALGAQSNAMRIYWIDAEGGAATLFVAPSGESLLFDTGFRVDDRDAKRIYATAQKAGLKQIDHVVVSHWHEDHEGGLAALSKMIPMVHFYDHGNGVEDVDRGRLDDYNQVASSTPTIL